MEINLLLAINHSRGIPLIKDTPTMILGMDVSHGCPCQSDILAIAAIIFDAYIIVCNTLSPHSRYATLHQFILSML